MIVFSIKNLSFTYPLRDKPAIKNISLTVNSGEFITICGKSGSGKSTLLRNMKPDICANGKREKIGFVLQNPESQIFSEKVWQAMEHGLEGLGLDEKIVKLRVAEMASFFGIESWFEKNIKELSGGQRQILNLAAVMITQPEVLILDEPTAQLDPIAASEFLESVGKINREIGTTIIITEHRLDDVLPLSNRTIVMEKGEIIIDDLPANVGALLAIKNNDMFAAMPATLQAYGKLYKAGFGRELQCPITVRDGRRWLSTLLMGIDLKVEAIKRKELEVFKGKTPAVKIKETWFRYDRKGKDIVKDLSLEVYKGELFTIVGGNGTGKSTALKILSGEKIPYRGKAHLSGKIGILPQNPLHIFKEENLIEEFKGIIDKKEEIAKVADLLEITELLNSKPQELSGGEQQRAALAKVLLEKPEILLLDEPTKGLDNHFKAKLANILCNLKEKGITIIMVSHDIEFCGKYADRCAMFFDGNIVTINTPDKFFSGNSFYTTAANRMSRHKFDNAITADDIVDLCRNNL